MTKAAQLLHDNKLSLIVWNAMPKVFVGEDDQYPECAIGDYGSDYGEDAGDWGMTLKAILVGHQVSCLTRNFWRWVIAK